MGKTPRPGLSLGLFLAGRLSASTGVGQHYLTISVFGRAPLFLSGMLAAWIYQRAGDPITRRLHATTWLRRGGADAAVLAIVLVLGALLYAFLQAGLAPMGRVPGLGWLLIAGPLWSGLLLLLLTAPLWSKRLFVNRVWSRLGVLSYSIYLLHVAVIMLPLQALRRVHLIGFGWQLDTALFAVLASGVCFALASLTYRFIERPFLLRKERLQPASGALAAARAVKFAANKISADCI